MWSLKPSPELIYRRIFYLTAGLLYGSVGLRALFLYRDSPALGQVLGLLIAWLVLFLTEPAFSLKWRRYFPIFLLLQTIVICSLMYGPDFPEYDFFGLLFAIATMQMMQRLPLRTGAAWMAAFALLTALPLVLFSGLFQGLALTLLYTSVNLFLAAYALATRRAQEARTQNQAMTQTLLEANRQLQARATQLEQLTVRHERQHLARDLHDSVTQTIFSMTLTTQSALLLLERAPANLRPQLDRLDELAHSALAEMRVLISELRSEQTAAGGLGAALRRHLAERRLPEGLAVALDVEGGQTLTPAEEQGLFRIAQEALNNIVKHAQASQACIRLHLAEPFWMEIEDQGQGFDGRPGQPGGGMGLASMRERAVEIGWTLRLTTSPGAGTRVRVDKPSGDSSPC